MIRRSAAYCLASVAALTLACATSHATGWPGDPATNVPVCTNAATQHFPITIADGAGGVFIAWADARGVDTDIYLQRLTASGTVAPGWPVDGLPICTATGIQEEPVVVADAGGGVIVAWEDRRGGLESDVYGTRIAADGTLAPGWVANGTPLCVAPGYQGDLDALGVSDGSAILTWWDTRADDGDIYALRVTGAGAVPPAWVGGVALCTASAKQSVPRIATDDGSGAIVVWEDERNGAADLYAMRVTGAGALGGFWTLDGSPVCTAADFQINPSIVTDGDHGVIVAWEDARGAETDIYAKRVTRTGGTAGGWDPEGEPLCTAAWYQSGPRIVPDGAGGAIAVWDDARGSDADIYAQRIDAAGNIVAGWEADGEPLVTGLGHQLRPEPVPDGLGGAIVGWWDQRSVVGTDIYAQRVTAAGDIAAGWTVGGVAVSTASGDQVSHTIAGDGMNGAILCWQDSRNRPSLDLFAQRIEADGDLGRAAVDVPGPEAPAFRLAPISPSLVSREATIRFSLARAARVSLLVVDATGRRVRTLVRGAVESGERLVTWNLRDERGSRVVAGVYWIRLEADAASASRALVVMR